MAASEVTVTRRYYRSGENEFYINKQSARLRDVNELFMDTGLGKEGYSNISQGRIDEILAVKSTDRREVFEEAAGISKYRHRKEETERRLERTEDNLLRINDKISELELQVEPLREQAEKAKKYLALGTSCGCWRSPSGWYLEEQRGKGGARRALTGYATAMAAQLENPPAGRRSSTPLYRTPSRTEARTEGSSGETKNRRRASRRPPAGHTSGGRASKQRGILNTGRAFTPPRSRFPPTRKRRRTAPRTEKN